MGVDISFHIEVRHRNEWRPLIWQMPMELKSHKDEKDEGKGWFTNSCCYWCRYYHFRDFLDDYGNVGLPDDVSPQMKTELSDYEMGQGYFMLSNLSNFCEQQEKDLLVRLLQSRDYQITKQLNRIERFLKQEPTTKDESDEISYEGMSIKEIYEDFQDEYWYYQSLHLSVRGFLKGANNHKDDKDIRILYGIW